MDPEPLAGRDVVDPVNVFDIMASCGVVPVAVIEDAADAVPLGESLLAAGLPCIEVTFRTSAAAESIDTLTRELPDLLVGAGTVLTVDQAESAVDAGSRFVVSPALDASVVSWCRERRVPVVPGVMTPSEVHAARGLGVDVVKFFPAQAAGGPGTVRAMASVFPDVGFVPTGGVGPANLGDYLAVPAVVACGGTWIADRASVAAGEWSGIRQRASAAVEIVRDTRAAT